LDRILDIKKRVNYYRKKMQTSDPFKIADSMGIAIIYEELGNIKGYYNKILRMKQIHVNQNLSEQDAIYTVSHELGHAILHPDCNTAFLRQYTFQSVGRLENEAHQFALELLISDEELIEYLQQQFTVEHLATIYGLPVCFINMRLQSLFL